MDWILSAVTVLGMELTMRKLWYGWLVGLLNQGLWGIFIYQKQAWGLIPLSVVLTVQYTRGMVRWYREAKEVPDDGKESAGAA